MPKIEFRGKIYNNEFEMPPDERRAYQKEQSARKNDTGTKSLSDIVDMSPEVKALYERALDKVEDDLPASRSTQELPKTEDIYRQSAPDDMKHLPSDESIYRPSQSVIDPGRSTIEPESGLGMSRFISSIIWAFILVAAAYLIMRFLL